MFHLSKLMPALTGLATKRALSSTAALSSAARKNSQTSIPDNFELLPPGCSIADPTYGLNEDTTVLHYDNAAPSEASKAPKKRVPKTPMNLKSAQQKLQTRDGEEDEGYVYLPPGCSIREPGYNSMSDPMDQRVYYRDPSPTLKK